MTAAVSIKELISDADRERMFNAIYVNTHRDFKGHYNGQKTVMSHAKYGFGLVSCQTMSDAELRARYSSVRPK